MSWLIAIKALSSKFRLSFSALSAKGLLLYRLLRAHSPFEFSELSDYYSVVIYSS